MNFFTWLFDSRCENTGEVVVKMLVRFLVMTAVFATIVTFVVGVVFGGFLVQAF